MNRQLSLARAGRFSSSLVITALLIAAIVAGNIIIERLGKTADLTAASRLTLTDETHRILDQVTETLSIEVFVRPDSGPGRDAIALASRYRDANRNVDLEVVDPDAEPGRVRQAGVTQFGVSVLTYDGRRVDVSTTTETDLTSGILRLVRGDIPTACFIEGHGEASIDDDGPRGLTGFATQTRRGGFDVESRLIGRDGLDDCDAVVIAGPVTPLAESEEDALVDHLEDQGKVLVLADALTEADINPVIENWGINFLGGVVLDRASNFNNDLATPAITDFPSANPVVEDVPSALMPAAAGLLVPDPDPRSGLFVSVLARTSDDSVLSADPEDPEAGGLAGPIVVAAAADDSRVVGDPPVIERTRLLVISDVAFATNAFIDALGNASLLANGMSWLVQDELLLTLGSRAPDARPLVVTPSRRRTAFGVTVIGVPLLLAAAGAATLLVRRRR